VGVDEEVLQPGILGTGPDRGAEAQLGEASRWICGKQELRRPILEQQPHRFEHLGRVGLALLVVVTKGTNHPRNRGCILSFRLPDDSGFQASRNATLSQLRRGLVVSRSAARARRATHAKPAKLAIPSLARRRRAGLGL